MRLKNLEVSCLNCTKCEIRASASNIVYGVGPNNPDYMIIGEAPGYNEDVQGEPFVGKAGQKLTDLINKVWNIPRDEVYFTNVLKCRPPDNRNPSETEFYNCRIWLYPQIDEISPKVILTVGKFAYLGLIGKYEPQLAIGSVIGNSFTISSEHNNEIIVVPTWHPAYVLRNPEAEMDMIRDMKLAKEITDRGKRTPVPEPTIW